MAKSNTRITADKDEVAIYTYEYTATSGQTTFSGSDDNSATLDYTAGSITVSYGGLELPESDYTATNGTSVVLADGAVAGEIIRVVAYEPFVVSDALPITGGTLTGDLDVTGTVTADGLTVAGVGGFTASQNTDGQIRISNATTRAAGNKYGVRFADSSFETNAAIYAEQSSSGNNASSLVFGTNAGTGGIALTSASERLRIDSSGRITTPNQPAFIACDLSGGASSSTGLFSDEFTTTLKNNGGHYNTSTGYFTAPVAGYYLFGWNLFTTVSGTTTSRAGIWHNGSTTGYGFSSGSTVAGTAQGSVLMYLNANDTAALGTQGSSYTAYWYAVQNHNRFWGYLVG